MYKQTNISILAGLAGLLMFASPAVASPLAWGAPVSISSSPLTSVSCSSATSCVAVDEGGNALTYNSSAWSAPVNLTPYALYGVSCTSSVFCVAVDGGGRALTYNGSTWSAPVTISSNGLISVSCPSASFCMAVGFEGSAVTYNGTTWSAPVSVGYILLSVSCVSESFCAAGGVNAAFEGSLWIYNGSSWGTPVSTGSPWINSVSCSSASFCVAGDGYGNARTYNGSTWSAPTSISSSEIRGVSCPSTTFCVAVDYGGNALTYNGSAWSAPVMIDPSVGLSEVSCPSTEFCAAVSSNKDAIVGKPPVPLTLEKLSTGTGKGTVISSPAGIECLPACESQTAEFVEGSLVTLTASATEDSIFKSWMGCVKTVAGTGPKGRTCTVEMTKALTVKAKFMKVWPITASKKAGSGGQGTISSAPAGISCSASCSTATGLFEAGQTVLLKAIPVASSSQFNPATSWSGCDEVNGEGKCEVVATAAKSVEAEFTAIPPNPLSLTKAGAGYGTVSSAPAGISCGPYCTEAAASFLSTKTVLLKAAPKTGEAFTGWSGCDEVNGEGKCEVTMSEAKAVTAEFK